MTRISTRVERTDSKACCALQHNRLIVKCAHRTRPRFQRGIVRKINDVFDAFPGRPLGFALGKYTRPTLGLITLSALGSLRKVALTYIFRRRKTQRRTCAASSRGSMPCSAVILRPPSLPPPPRTSLARRLSSAASRALSLAKYGGRSYDIPAPSLWPGEKKPSPA